jgi:hypothetical protein
MMSPGQSSITSRILVGGSSVRSSATLSRRLQSENRFGQLLVFHYVDLAQAVLTQSQTVKIRRGYRPSRLQSA